MAHVKLYGNLRRMTTQSRCIVEGATVREILDALTRDNPRLRGALFHDHALAEHIRITRNGRDIRHAKNLETPLNENDELAIFPPVAGGQHIAYRELRIARISTIGDMRHAIRGSGVSSCTDGQGKFSTLI